MHVIHAMLYLPELWWFCMQNAHKQKYFNEFFRVENYLLQSRNILLLIEWVVEMMTNEKSATNGE